MNKHFNTFSQINRSHEPFVCYVFVVAYCTRYPYWTDTYSNIHIHTQCSIIPSSLFGLTCQPNGCEILRAILGAGPRCICCTGIVFYQCISQQHNDIYVSSLDHMVYSIIYYLISFGLRRSTRYSCPPRPRRTLFDLCRLTYTRVTSLRN